MDLLSLWEKMLANLKQVLPKEIFTNWFEGNIIPYSYSEEENLLILDTMTNFLRDYVSKKYTDILETVAQDAIGRPTRVQLITSQEKKPAPESQPEAVAETITLPKKPAALPAPAAAAPAGDAQSVPSGQTEWVQPELPISDGPSAPMPVVKEAVPVTPDEIPYNNNLNKDYTFDNFIVGNSNRVATAVAKSIAAAPAQKWNPFYIYGGSGLGKTHLIYAICGKIRQNHPDYKLLYVKGEEFANELILAIRNGTTAEFKEKYRQADLLAVDDIQFIAGKESTQEEFFHTFNSLYECGKQIILTSDRPPKEIKTLEDRLRTRFEWGLLVDVQPPDFETRMAIISRKADSLGLALPEDVAAFIAGKLKDNVRQLEGVVKRLDAHANLTGAPITMLLAENAIQDIMTEQTPLPVTVDRIIDEVARTYGVTAEDIRGQRRSNQISTARQVVREITGMTQLEIGQEFGGRDHSTVVYALQQVTKAIQTDPRKKEVIEDIIKNIRNLNG